MKTFLLAVVAAVLAGCIATYVRYESFSPCSWMAQEMAQETGLPAIVVRGRIQAEFMLKGISEPDAGDCVLAWWRHRRDGMPRKR